MELHGLPEPQRRILEAAIAVFGANGYRGGSLNEIAKRSGYTRAGLLHHFPSKEAILLALLDLRDERLHLMQERPDDGGWLASVDALPELVAQILQDRVLIQLAHALTAEASHPDHPAREWAARRHQALRTMVAAGIRQSIDRDELDPDIDPDALAAVFLGVVEGVEAQWLVNPDVDPVRCAEILVTMIHGLADAHLLKSSPASAT